MNICVLIWNLSIMDLEIRNEVIRYQLRVNLIIYYYYQVYFILKYANKAYNMPTECNLQ